MIRELVERSAAGADDEFANAAGRVEPPVGILRREAFVGVVVAADDEIDVELVERAPHVPHVGIVAVAAGAEERPVPIHRRAGRGACVASSLRSHSICAEPDPEGISLFNAITFQGPTA